MRCTAADDKALRHITENWKRGYNEGDAARVAALYTPDAVYLTQHFIGGVIEGRAAIQAYVQRRVDAKYHVDDIAVLRMDCSQDMAYVVGRYTSMNAGQKARGVNLVVLRKVHGDWKIAAHEAAVPDPATAVQKLDIPRK
jgi:uncharacterized protein (TIGR02246 family)